MRGFPEWRHYPSDVVAGPWAEEVLKIFAQLELQISTEHGERQCTRDELLALLRPSLERVGYVVESGRSHSDRVSLPVKFGARGTITHEFHVDAYRAGTRTVLGVEAGRGAQNNEDLKNLIHTALIHEVDHLALAVPVYYKFGRPEKVQVKRAYDHTRELFDLIFASTRVDLGLKGVLLIGY